MVKIHLQVSCRQQILNTLHLPHGGSGRLSFDLIRKIPGPTPLGGRKRASDIGSVVLYKDSADQIKSLGVFIAPAGVITASVLWRKMWALVSDTNATQLHRWIIRLFGHRL